MTGEVVQNRVLNLNDLPLETVTAHGGEGDIKCKRVFDAEAFEGTWNFVDYAVLPPGTSIGLHTHGRDEEIYLVLAGEGLMHLDGREFRVRPGSVIRNLAGGTHGLMNDGEEEVKIFVVEVGLNSRS